MDRSGPTGKVARHVTRTVEPAADDATERVTDAVRPAAELAPSRLSRPVGKVVDRAEGTVDRQVDRVSDRLVETAGQIDGHLLSATGQDPSPAPPTAGGGATPSPNTSSEPAAAAGSDDRRERLEAGVDDAGYSGDRQRAGLATALIGAGGSTTAALSPTWLAGHSPSSDDASGSGGGQTSPVVAVLGDDVTDRPLSSYRHLRPAGHVPAGPALLPGSSPD